MTTTVSTPQTTSATSSYAIGAAIALVAATLTTLFAHTWGEAISMVALIVVVSGFVYGYLVPRGLRSTNAGGTALSLAVVGAVVAVPAFWTGMPLVLGVAAMILGNAGRTSRHGAGTSIAALVLGTLTSLFYLSIYVVEGAAGNTGFLFS